MAELSGLTPELCDILSKIYERSVTRETPVAVKPRERAERHPSVPKEVFKSLLVLQSEPTLSHEPAEVDVTWT